MPKRVQHRDEAPASADACAGSEGGGVCSGAVHYNRDGILALEGDMREVLAGMEAESFSACVCDPPYGLEFMGKEWDKLGAYQGQTKGGKDAIGVGKTRVRYGKSTASMQGWFEKCFRAVLRVLKPGGMLMAFGGTRTFHRMACAVEDAGFEIRDTLMWMYGSGFPKSLDISKAIDKAAGVEREVVGEKMGHTHGSDEYEGGWGKEQGKMIAVEVPATPQAALWQGYGTALKPAFEPIILAMKPLDGTFAGNALKHGGAGLNVDGGRIGTEDVPAKVQAVANAIDLEYQRGRKGEASADRRYADRGATNIAATPGPRGGAASGRWPANVILSHDERCVCVGTTHIQVGKAVKHRSQGNTFGGSSKKPPQPDQTYGDANGKEQVDVYACVPGCPVRMLDEQSGVSRSTHIKANPHPAKRHGSALELNTGKSGWEDGRPGGFDDTGTASRFFYTAKASSAERQAGLSPAERCNHPTVKPIDLMRYLLTLVTMPKDTRILDPFMGSGSTCVAAKQLRIACVGIDSDPESCRTAAGRLSQRTTKGIGKHKKMRRKRCRRK